MGITLIGQTGLPAVDPVAEESKPGSENVSTPVPVTEEEIARRLGQLPKRSTATPTLAQVKG